MDNRTESTVNVLDIIRGTTVDGPGFRTSIYFAGCRHQCPGCHNPQSWDFDGGTPFTVKELMDVIEEEDFNVTFSGGDPLYHPSFVAKLAEAVTKARHTVWLYTGFLWEDILKSPKLTDAIKNVEVIVDGPFIEAKKDLDLLFRGSSNQRLIDVQASISSSFLTTILWHR